MRQKGPIGLLIAMIVAILLIAGFIFWFMAYYGAPIDDGVYVSNMVTEEKPITDPFANK